MEEKVIAINPGRRSKSLKVDGFPLDLSNEKWASIIGIILDSRLRKEFVFCSTDKNLAEYVKNSFEKVGLRPYFKSDDEKYLVKGHSVVKDLLFLCGINTREKQISSNICLPAWIFDTNREYQAIILAKFLDTEGYVCEKKGTVCIAQCNRIILDDSEKYSVLSSSRSTIIKPSNVESKMIFFGKIDANIQEKILENVPLILVSTQLLLRNQGINSHLYPLRLTIDSKGNVSALWNLKIQTNNDLVKFYKLCEPYITIKYKLARLISIKDKKTNLLPRQLKKVFYLKHAQILEQRTGFFTVSEMIAFTNRAAKSVYNEIGALEQKGYFYSIFKNGHIKHRKLTLLGKQYLDENNCSLEEYDSLFLR